MTNQPFDHQYWGDKIDLDRWKGSCRRGLVYKSTGVEHAGPGQRHTFSGGRKARGSSADDLSKKQPKKPEGAK